MLSMGFYIVTFGYQKEKIDSYIFLKDTYVSLWKFYFIFPIQKYLEAPHVSALHSLIEQLVHEEDKEDMREEYEEKQIKQDEEDDGY